MRIEESSCVETQDYKVIIYPASRPFTTREAMQITQEVYEFLSGWKAHDKALSASFKIEYNQFIIITIDEEIQPVSGCSMDALLKKMKELDQRFELGLLDRMKACYRYIGEKEIHTLPLLDFRQKVEKGKLKEIEVFNFSKNTYLDFITHFIQPLGRSWAAAYSPK